MTSKSDSHFVRKIPHARVTSLRLAEARRHELPGDTELVRRVPQRPSQYRIDVENPWEDPAIARHLHKRQPTRGAFYIGRILEGSPDGEYSVELWEVPSGRTAFATLPQAAWLRRGRKHPPAPGEHVRVWTWEEQGEPHMLFVAARRELAPEERAELRKLRRGTIGDDPSVP